MIDRKQALQFINAARIVKKHDFARSVAADWLSAWPMDLQVQTQMARCEVDVGMLPTAIQRLLDIVHADPENPEAYEVLASALAAQDEMPRAALYACCGSLLRRRAWEFEGTPPWADQLAEAIRALDQGDATKAILAIQNVLAADPDLPLPMILAVKAHRMAGNHQAALALARTGHNIWPDCVPFLLLLAEERFSEGDHSRGVDYLHQVASRDPTGSLTEEYLGADHPYKRLWPEKVLAHLSRPVPAEVTAIFGRNRIASGGSSTAGLSEDGAPPLAREGKELEHLSGSGPQDAQAQQQEPPQLEESDLPEPMPWEAFRGPDPGSESPEPTGWSQSPSTREEVSPTSDGQGPLDSGDRFPAYVVLSSRTRLSQTFGEERFQRIDDAIIDLIETIRRKPDWTAYRFYVDDPASAESFGLSVADPGNAWQIKLRLADLDSFLAQRGEMIGALFIVGGDGIVPFHYLPNATDDDDDVVLSDNPYGTTTENYFTPDWPVGRLPLNDEPELLVRLLQNASLYHASAIETTHPLRRLFNRLRSLFGGLLHRKPASTGYTASIWRKASLAVYRAIGEPGSLLTSPPMAVTAKSPLPLKPSTLSYFNLHGLEDAPEWYGQRDPLKDEREGPDFPIALRPEDISNGNGAAAVVFSEACYGANIEGKTSETALCLKFLSSGCRAVVGSTKISYGSLAAPLIAADLLGRLFWENLIQGMATGEALRRAKLTLATEMHRRQGYLDGEDQKTLVSFVLYGDPLYVNGMNGAAPIYKHIRRKSQVSTKLTAAMQKNGADPTAGKPEEMERVRNLMAQYLPGMADAQCRVQPQYVYRLNELQFNPADRQVKRLAPGKGESVVFSFSKTIADGNRNHTHYARLTLNETGKVMKLSVSR